MEAIQPPVSIICRTSTIPEADLLATEIARELKLQPITAQILLNRGVDSPEAARHFLTPTLRHALPDPHTIKGIQTAAALLLDAIGAGEAITLFTDFDVDGLSAGAQLYLFLRALGGSVNHYTPSRFHEGYGLSLDAVEKFVRAGTKLLVTIDCGISNEREIALAKRKGLRIIVLDHHLPHTIPPADAIVNPAQGMCPFEEYRLCAAGLVWMLLVVLRAKLRSRGDLPALPDPKEFLDLAALGTICDMVPLTRINRLLAYRGVEALQTSSRPGIISLKEIAGIPANKMLTAGQVSFLLGPRINAAGRLKDGALAFELLTTGHAARARLAAQEMNALNQERRSLEEIMRERCVTRVRADHGTAIPPVLSVFDEQFHVGVLGIVAQRLVEEFYRPAVVLAPGESVVDGSRIPVIKGSIRSIPGFHVAEALQALSSLCLSQGGHREAGGVTLLREKLPQFCEELVNLASSLLPAEKLVRTTFVDGEIDLGKIDFDLTQELLRLAPFGVGNPSPLLVTREVILDSVVPFGDRHLRLRFSRGGYTATGVMWRATDRFRFRRGEQVSIAYHPEINSYQGLSSVQLNIKEIW